MLMAAIGGSSPLASCGWEGEEPVTLPAEDTVFNDLTYTAVTGKVSNLTAVATNLHGWANSSNGYFADFSEQGFLLSRYVSNPSLDDVDNEGVNVVRRIPVDEVGDDNTITTRAYGLIPNTSFYYRAYVVRKSGEVVYGIVKTFMTLGMSITIEVPDRVGLFDCDLSATVSGFGTLDYNKGASVKFRCADTEITGASTQSENAPTATYDKRQRATRDADKETRYRCSFDNLIPGVGYRIVAYIDVQSEFYDYENDNPLRYGQYAYGTEAQNVETDKYQSSVISLAANALVGIKSYANSKYTLNYDAVEILDNYFTLPSDTLEATEYGIAIAKGDSVKESNRILFPSTDELRTGRRYDVFINGLSLKTNYSYKSYVIVHGITVFSTETWHFATKDYDPVVVDLGLSVKWADRNLGAPAANEVGAYYAWGETSVKKTYTDDNYTGATLDDTDISGGTKDAATVKWGPGWRIPTTAEIMELYDECEWKWAKDGDMSGYTVIGPNENSIFLPASGIKIKDEVEDTGKMGYYWTSERASTENDYGFAYELYILNGLSNGNGEPLRKCHPTFGLNIRAVYTGN